MTDLDYRPVRILKGISAACATVDELTEKYPHGEEPTVVKSRGAKTDTLSRVYKPGQVIDAPTPEERELFDTVPDTVAIEIPQHADGYDDPMSGYARSRVASERGRQKFLLETTARANKASKKSSKKKTSKKSSGKEATDK